MRKPPENACDRCGRIRKTWDKGVCSCCRDVVLELGEGEIWGVKNQAPKTLPGGPRMCSKGVHELKWDTDVYRRPGTTWEECVACKRARRLRRPRRTVLRRKEVAA